MRREGKGGETEEKDKEGKEKETEKQIDNKWKRKIMLKYEKSNNCQIYNTFCEQKKMNDNNETKNKIESKR